jgi:GNAT superfamily N-acetyltransferase
MSQVELLPVGAADDGALVEELVRVINEAYDAGEDGLWRDGWTRITRAEVAQAIRSERMLAATMDARVVGCAYVRSLDANTADLGLVSVTPEHWGAGVGSEIVRAAEDLVRGRGVTTMRLELLVPQGWVHPHKDRLREWYTRLGYEVIETVPFEQVATHAASQLATACEFLVFRKRLAAGPGA